jgi:hypothetical protein
MVIEDLAPLTQDLDTWAPYGTGGAPQVDRVADWGAPDQDDDGIVAPYPGDPDAFDTYFVDPLTQFDAAHHVVRVLLFVRIGTTLALNNVVVHVRARRGDVESTLPGLLLPAAASGNQVSWWERTFDLSSYRPGGGAWLESDFGDGAGACSFGLATGYDDGGAYQPHVAALKVQCAHQPIGVLLPGVRLAASSIAWRLRHPDTRARIVVPADFTVDLGGDLWASASDAPTPEGTGWGVDTAAEEPRPLWCTGVEEDLAAHTLGLTCWPLRGRLVHLLDSGRSTGTAAAPDGLMQLQPAGATHTFERSSVTYLLLSDGLVHQVPIDVQAIGPRGRRHEGGATNAVLWSAFQEGMTWLLAAGAAIVDGGEPLFAPAVQARVIETPAGGSAAQSGVVLPVGVNVLSIAAAGAAAVVIYRPSAAQYYDAAADAWGAAVVANPIGTDAARSRRVLRCAVPGATPYTVTLTLQPAGASTVRWWHVQAEAARAGLGWPSSRIVTRESAPTSQHSYLATSNEAGARTWPAATGTARWRFTTSWASAEATDAGKARTFVLTRVTWGADYHELAWVAATGVLRFRVHSAGVDHDVSLPVDWAAGEEYRLAAAWQAATQNGDLAGTIRVGCNGLVARAVATAVTEAATSTMVRGSAANADGSQAKGDLAGTIVEPWALSDAELWED